MSYFVFYCNLPDTPYTSGRVLHGVVRYLYARCSGSITSVGEESELVCLLSFTCNHEVSVWRDFLFLCVLGMGCFIYCGTP